MRRTGRLVGRLVLGGAVVSWALGAAACGDSRAQEPVNTVHVLAGSELKDVEPLLPDVRAKTGINLVFDYVGTLDGAERIANGGAGNDSIAWFSSTRYLSLLPGGAAHIVTSQKIALSPVVLGVKRSKAQQLGWENNPDVTWKDIAQAANDGRFSFGMTNPASSNSGFSALVGVAAAFSGTPNALTVNDINADQLKQFFSGQHLTAGSSGFLADTYVGNEGRVDGLINYESVLLGLDAGGRLHEPLDLVYPRDGIITADYPLVLLDSARRSQYDAVVAYFRNPDVQRRLMTETNRRPTAVSVPLDSRFGTQTLIELPFPAQLSVVDALIERYLDLFSRPTHTVYVLDLSGSMDGPRLQNLQAAFSALTDPKATGTARFARFRSREHITIVTFSSQVQDVRSFTVADANNASDLAPIKSYVNGLHAGGATAIYSAMDQAYQEVGKQRVQSPGDLFSVVLMTDGENNSGESSDDFINSVRQQQLTDVPAFPILFGEGDVQQLTQIATVTGGKVFDSRTVPLSDIFKQIRGYQ
jgi:Ca-activated chloride channel family protein